MNLALLAAALKAAWDALWRWSHKPPRGLLFESWVWPYGKIRLFDPTMAPTQMEWIPSPAPLLRTGDSITVTHTVTFS